MVTISACMIVKNEEKVLARCLDSLDGIVDELIIVDTGSTDGTKQIAAGYTDRIYDFEWTGDFAEARNFSFSFATMEYIYQADADEVIDEDNRRRFLELKNCLLPEIEIVQMYYTNQLAHNTTYNFDRELRPKLYKRLRSFCFIDPVHEGVRLEPVVYDSEIEIIHMPQNVHAGRDLSIFRRATASGQTLSARLMLMYERELMVAGEKEDFEAALVFFENMLEAGREEEELRRILCVLMRGYRLLGEERKFFAAGLKGFACKEPCSEACYEAGEFFLGHGDLNEAVMWYYNASYETKPEIAIGYGGELPIRRLAECYRALGDMEQEKYYRGKLEEILGEKSKTEMK